LIDVILDGIIPKKFKDKKDTLSAVCEREGLA
jgi:hypothetical protein